MIKHVLSRDGSHVFVCSSLVSLLRSLNDRYCRYHKISRSVCVKERLRYCTNVSCILNIEYPPPPFSAFPTYILAFSEDCSVESTSKMAMNKARANVRLPPEVNRVLYVRNLPYKITAEEMYDIFGKYGAIRQIRFVAKPRVSSVLRIRCHIHYLPT